MMYGLSFTHVGARMIRKFISILMLAGLTACASNSRISAAPEAADTSGTNTEASASSTGSDSLSSGSSSDSGTSYGASTGESSSFTSQQPMCDAQPVQKLIGTKLTPAITEQAQKDSTSNRTRVLRPGEVMTMEYNPNRLNLILDKQDALTALRCG
jgi:hypothetical protein